MPRVVCFPFDSFGGSGTGAGATLLTDVVREILDDVAEEKRPTRTAALAGKVTFDEWSFDTSNDIDHWRKSGTIAIKAALKSKEFVLWLGGNHLGCLPIYEVLGPEDMIVQFDAHLDTFDLHDTKETLSHGNFVRHAKRTCKLVNVGHRDLIQTEEFIGQHYQAAIPIERLAMAFDSVAELASVVKRIWIDIDVDVFEPSVCPAVQLRTPYGMMPVSMIALIELMMKTGNVVGVSISEFDPGRDRDDATLNLLGWLVEWILLKATR